MSTQDFRAQLSFMTKNNMPTRQSPYDTNQVYRRPDEPLNHPYDLSRGWKKKPVKSQEQIAAEKRISRQLSLGPYGPMILHD